MNIKLLLLILSMTSFMACDVSDVQEQEKGQQQLENMLSEIVALSKSVSCQNAPEWRFTAIGSKPCGGPRSFIAYSSKIDTTRFLVLVEEHRQAEDTFNRRWGVASDCAVNLPPQQVVCENGEPQLIYGQ